MNKDAVAEMSQQYQVEAAQKLVPEGYKQTEVGVIPEDWSVGSLHSVAAIERGKFSARPRNDPKYYGGEYPFLQTGDIAHSQGRIKSFTQTLNDAGLAVSRLFPKGTLFFTIAANIGDVGIADFEAACPDSIVGIIPRGKNSQEWLLYELASRQEEFELLASPGAQLNLNLEKLRPFLIPVPTVKEQTAIANALSDTDALLSELEKLIAKKQAIKTATMQQLLTGRTRLPQFANHPDGSKKGYKQSELGEIPEDWDVKSVFELANFQKSLFDDGDWVEAEHITNKGIRLIQTGNIGIGQYLEKGSKKYINEESFEKLKCKELQEGDLLICRLADPAGRACIMPNIGDSRVITSVDVTIFRPTKETTNRNFFVQYFSSSEWFKSVLEQVGGTTHKRISRGALGRISIPYPKIDEQTAIATILSDMDAEIQALEHRLNKTRQIKQGMMQELLTGKTRLVAPQVSK